MLLNKKKKQYLEYYKNLIYTIIRWFDFVIFIFLLDQTSEIFLKSVV